MRVIYSIGARFAGGGIGNTAYRAVSGLYRHGLLSRLICGSYRPTEIPAERIRSMGLVSRGWRWTAVRSNQRWLTLAYNRLYDHWSTRQLEPCDLFHCWGSFGLRALKRAKQLGAVTSVERASYHPVAQTRLLEQEYSRWGLPYTASPTAVHRAVAEIEAADYVLIPSEVVQRTFLEQGVPAEKLIQIPFGVDVQRFRPATGARRGNEPFRALFVGNVSILKGVPHLLAAWEALNWKDAELWLVGRDSLPHEIWQNFGNLPGLCRRGYVADPVALFQKADVFAFPSLTEGSALVTYEAMACGLPLVTTANAGSVARHGREGFIIPPNDADALAKRLEQLRADVNQRQQMGANARLRAEQFSWERYQESLVAAFRDVVIDT